MTILARSTTPNNAVQEKLKIEAITIQAAANKNGLFDLELINLLSTVRF